MPAMIRILERATIREAVTLIGFIRKIMVVVTALQRRLTCKGAEKGREIAV